jgi:hypothetical protein
MLCSELFESFLYDDMQVLSPPKQGPVEVGNTTALINPSVGDMAKMFSHNHAAPLRALTEPGRFVVWPAEEALHQPMQIALNMDRRARRYIVYANTQSSPRATSVVGRYNVWVKDDTGQQVKPIYMSQQMKSALAVRA